MYAIHSPSSFFLSIASFSLFGMQALYEEAIPAFNVLGKRSFYLGQVGNGAKMKLVVNMIMGR